MKKTTWTLEEAVALCVLIEGICPKFGCHIGLTGGTLYKPGERKDCDIIFYRIRQVERIDLEGLWKALDEVGIQEVSGFGWCHKATYQGKSIDIFFPEEVEGDEYVTGGATSDAMSDASNVMTDDEFIAFVEAFHSAKPDAAH